MDKSHLPQEGAKYQNKVCENSELWGETIPGASDHHDEKGQGTAVHNYSQLDPQCRGEGHQQVRANGMTDSKTLAHSATVFPGKVPS